MKKHPQKLRVDLVVPIFNEEGVIEHTHKKICEVVDVLLMGWGVWTLGSEALEAGKDLYQFVMTATQAQNDKDVDKAADYLARAIAIIDVDGLAAILAHKAFKAVREGEGIGSAESSRTSVLDSGDSPENIAQKTTLKTALAEGPAFRSPVQTPPGKSFSGEVMRATHPEYLEPALKIHPKNVTASHRYSGRGLGAVYTSTSESGMIAEMNHYGIRMETQQIVRQEIKVNNVLDLTDPAVRQQVGVTEAQLTGDDYTVTQAVGQWASTRYNAILAPSARQPGATNIVIFKPGAIQ